MIKNNKTSFDIWLPAIFDMWPKPHLTASQCMFEKVAKLSRVCLNIQKDDTVLQWVHLKPAFKKYIKMIVSLKGAFNLL